MLHPTAAYRSLAENYPPLGAAGALRRPAFVVLVIACAIAIAATGRVTAPLVISLGFTWGWTVLWQVLVAAVITRSATVPLTFAQRIDLFFAGHAPWSLWLLLMAAWSRLLPQFTDLYAILVTVIVPGAWTLVIVRGFCGGALGLPRREATVRAIAHQALIWGVAFVYVAWAVALWPRFVG